MRFVTALLGLTLLILSQDAARARVYLGNEVLAMRGFETLRGKRVGRLTNPSGVDGRGRSVIDLLHRRDVERLWLFVVSKHRQPSYSQRENSRELINKNNNAAKKRHTLKVPRLC